MKVSSRSIDLISKKKNKFARAAHFFLSSKKQICACSMLFCLYLLVFCTTTMLFWTTKMSNFFTHFFFMEELSYLLTKDFVSCIHVRFYFFTAAHFHPATSISHFLTATMKFSCFSSNEIRLPSSFSVIHLSVNIKNYVKKDTTLFFSL